MAKLRSMYFPPGRRLRDVHAVTTSPHFDSFGQYRTPESWLVAIWCDPRFGTYHVQGRLRWYTRGPERFSDVPATTEATEHASLAQARKRAADLVLVLSAAMGVDMRTHDGREIRLGF